MKMTGVIAVHCGAGNHKSRNHQFYNRLAKKACKEGIEVLKANGSALDAVTAAVVVLENNPLTNAGYGSNLTFDGRVETDASVMDGKSLVYGGCGAIRKVKNPVKLAYDVCIKQSQPLPLGLVPPSLLVGAGGLQHAKGIGLKIVNDKFLMSKKAIRQYEKYKKLLDVEKEAETKVLDTVGAVCIDDAGHAAAASSSGGLLLKRPGRVGQAALYASGVWADSFDLDNEPGIAVCTTGCGEYLVRTQLAKEVAVDLKADTCATTNLYNSLTEKFLNSKYLHNVEHKLGGVLLLRFCKNKNEIAVLWGHSTESMSLGYMKTTDLKPKALVSQLPEDIIAGSKINVGGTYYYIHEDGAVPCLE